MKTLTLTLCAAATVALAANAAPITFPREEGKFVLQPLPYAANALEPFIDARTMEIHHGKHHAAYVKNLNDALASVPGSESKSLEAMLEHLSAVPESVRMTVRNNGGGHYNHALFWEIMRPGGSKPSGALANALTESFGSYDQFIEQFSKAAATRFGSGWAWLLVKSDGKLAISSTPNQDNPLMTGIVDVTGAPILGLDVWEHAYYLQYQNRRADYVRAWFNIVNWDKVAELYQAALPAKK